MINKISTKMISTAGLRTSECKAQRRHDVSITNGFRRFSNKACKESVAKESALVSLIKKRVHDRPCQTHKSGPQLLSGAYSNRPKSLLSVPSLTISDEAKLLHENSKQATKIRHREDEKLQG